MMKTKCEEEENFVDSKVKLKVQAQKAWKQRHKKKKTLKQKP